MRLFIASVPQILSKILLLGVLFSAISSSCYAQFLNKKWASATLITPNKKEIEVSWAISPMEKVQGLSDLDKSKMQKHEGLFFYYPIDEQRVFWMPSTKFNLDIIFLNRELKVVGLEENVPHFPKRSPDKDIPRTKSYYSRYVLELHAGMAKFFAIKKGDFLKWKSPNKVMKIFKSL